MSELGNLSRFRIDTTEILDVYCSELNSIEFEATEREAIKLKYLLKRLKARKKVNYIIRKGWLNDE